MDVLTQWFADSKCVEAPHRVTMEALGYILYDAPSSMRVVKNGGDMYIKLKRELVDWIEYKDQVSPPPHTHTPPAPVAPSLPDIWSLLKDHFPVLCLGFFLTDGVHIHTSSGGRTS